MEFADDTVALAWSETEQPNLLAAIQQAAATPGVPDEIATQLTQALFGFFVVRGHQQDWAHWQQALAIFEQLRPPEADQVRALLTSEGSATFTTARLAMVMTLTSAR